MDSIVKNNVLADGIIFDAGIIISNVDIKGFRENAMQLSQSNKEDTLNMLINNADKILALVNAFSSIEIMDDGSLYLKTKNHLIIDSEGHQIIHSKKGQVIIKSETIHLNPIIPIDNVKDIDGYIDEVGRVNSEFKSLASGTDNQCESCK